MNRSFPKSSFVKYMLYFGFMNYLFSLSSLHSLVGNLVIYCIEKMICRTILKSCCMFLVAATVTVIVTITTTAIIIIS